VFILDMKKMQSSDALSPEAQRIVTSFMKVLCAVDTMSGSKDTYTSDIFEAAEKKLREQGETNLADAVHEASERTITSTMAAASMLFQNILAEDFSRRGLTPDDALAVLVSLRADYGIASVSAHRPN